MATVVVDDELSFADRYRAALQALPYAGKSDYGAPAYSRFVNRPVGRRFAAAAAAVGATPNRVTLVSALFSFTAIVLLAAVPPSIALGVGVAVLLAIGYALDSADGQVARLQGSGSPAGEWLDHTVDMAKICLLHAAVLISWFRFDAELPLWQALVPLAFGATVVVSFFGWLLVDLLRRATPGAAEAARPKRAPLGRSLLRLPSDYGLLLWIFVSWSTPLFLWSYSALLAANAAILGLALPVWYRQARALPTNKPAQHAAKPVVGYVPGVYDLFHVGHLNILRRARAECDYLIAGAVTDERAEAVKGKRPVIPLHERMEILSSIGLVDEVVADNSHDKAEMLEQVKFDVIFKGDDWIGTPKGDQLEASMAAEGVRVHYFPYTETTSSTMVRQRIGE
jgi:cytidyltransferase-like protein